MAYQNFCFFQFAWLCIYMYTQHACAHMYTHTIYMYMWSYDKNFCLLITDSQGNPHHLCLVSYRLPHGFNPVVVPHGNSKSNQPFFPTLPSMKALIEAQSQRSGPKETLNVVSTKLGGVERNKGITRTSICVSPWPSAGWFGTVLYQPKCFLYFDCRSNLQPWSIWHYSQYIPTSPTGEHS